MPPKFSNYKILLQELEFMENLNDNDMGNLLVHLKRIIDTINHIQPPQPHTIYLSNRYIFIIR